MRYWFWHIVWLWQHKYWHNSRQKFKAMEREFEVHEQERRKRRYAKRH